MTLLELINSTDRLSVLKNDPNSLYAEIRKPTELVDKPLGVAYLKDRTLTWLMGNDPFKSGPILRALRRLATNSANDALAQGVLANIAGLKGTTADNISAGFEEIVWYLTQRDGIDMAEPAVRQKVLELAMAVRAIGAEFLDADIANICAYGQELKAIDEVELGRTVSLQEVFDAVSVPLLWTPADNPVVDCLYVNGAWYPRLTVVRGTEQQTLDRRMEGSPDQKPTDVELLNEARALADSLNQQV